MSASSFKVQWRECLTNDDQSQVTLLRAVLEYQRGWSSDDGPVIEILNTAQKMRQNTVNQSAPGEILANLDQEYISWCFAGNIKHFYNCNEHMPSKIYLPRRISVMIRTIFDRIWVIQRCCDTSEMSSVGQWRRWEVTRRDWSGELSWSRYSPFYHVSTQDILSSLQAIAAHFFLWELVMHLPAKN